MTLRGLLAQHPTALVGAIDSDGLFTEMPATVSVEGHRVPSARSALDLVQPEDRKALIEAWVSAKEHGAGLVEVGLAGTTAAPATIYIFDALADHGVYLGVVVASDAADGGLRDVVQIVPPPPRVTHIRKDEVATVTYIDAAFSEMLGWDTSEVIGNTSLTFVHHDDAERAIDRWMDCLANPGMTYRTRARHRHKDGRWIWLEVSNTNLLATDGYVDCEMFDISDEMEAHEAVRASERLLRRLAESLPVGVAQFDSNHEIVYANERLYEILGADVDADEQTVLSAVVDLVAVDRAITAVHSGQDVDMRVLIERLDDRERRQCTLTMRPLTNDDGTVHGGVLVLEDVTEDSRMRSELEHRATVDALTGCANRRTALNRLSEALTSARISRPRVGTAVIFVDLDDFKHINDRHGHATGDTVLETVGARLQRVVRGHDLVGRIGGDEFLIVCPDVVDRATAVAMAERVSASMEAPIDVGGTPLLQTVSVGVAWTGSGPRVDADTLIAQADAAMYAAKRARHSGNVVVPLHG